MKIAVITGASSGIGREFVRQIAKTEPDIQEIWAVARREFLLESLNQEVSIPVRAISLDLSNLDFLEPFRSLLESEKPEIALLVNGAGFGKFGTESEIAFRDAMDMIHVNCRAPVAMTRLCLPFILRGGRIIQIASTASFQPLPEANLYAATKAFLRSYSRALQVELKPREITVTALCPGWVETDFIPIARKNANGKAVTNFWFLSKAPKVVDAALKSSRRGKDLCVPGVMNKFHHAAAKLLPQKAVMAVWLKSQKK